jgi:hypothetical protein
LFDIASIDCIVANIVAAKDDVFIDSITNPNIDSANETTRVEEKKGARARAQGARTEM